MLKLFPKEKEPDIFPYRHKAPLNEINRAMFLFTFIFGANYIYILYMQHYKNVSIMILVYIYYLDGKPYVMVYKVLYNIHTKLNANFYLCIE